MTALQVVLLGVIQGLTEFLPVSSSGHLALAQMLFDARDGGLTVSVMMHAGTLVATVVILRVAVVRAVAEGTRAIVRPSLFRESPGGRDAFVVLVATVPTAVAGLLLRDAIAAWTGSPLAVGLGFVGTAALLVSTRWAAAGDDEVPSTVGALAIGFAQASALLPGVSRSGATIAAALWLGVRPDRAFELSMLMSLPAVLGAVVLELRHVGEAGGASVATASIGALTACVVGILALVVLRKAVVRGHFAWFAAWVVPLAVATLAFAKAWPAVR